jgi:predicted MFS family arabinose efflux permease
MSGTGVGQAVYAIALQHLITTWNEPGCYNGTVNPGAAPCEGWRLTMQAQAGISFAIMLAASLIVRKPNPGEVETHEEATRDKTVPATPTIEAVSTRKTPAPVGVVPGLSVGAALRSRWYLFLLLFRFFSMWGYSVFFIHVDAFANDSGLGSLAPTGLAVVGFSAIIGRIGLNIATDYLGRMAVMKAAALGLIASVIAWPYSGTHPAALYAVCIIFGLTAGSYPSIPPSLVADYGKAYTGAGFRLTGGLSFVGCLGATFAGPLSGRLYEASGNYHSASIYTAVTMGFGLLALYGVPKSAAHKAAIRAQLEAVTKTLRPEGDDHLVSLASVHLAPATSTESAAAGEEMPSRISWH